MIRQLNFAIRWICLLGSLSDIYGCVNGGLSWIADYYQSIYPNNDDCSANELIDKRNLRKSGYKGINVISIYW